MILLVFAALTCHPDVAPFLTLPPPAVTAGTLRAASVPGSVPFASAVRRLDGHAMSAMYGALEAWLERVYLPSLVNYGGARGKTLADLRTADFWPDSRSSVTNRNWYGFDLMPSAFVAATNRDYSARGRRLAFVRDLLDLDVLGDRPGTADEDAGGFSGTLGLNPFDAYWLDPRISHASLPDGNWHLDDETATADWSRYLVMLGELDARGVYDEEHTPYLLPTGLEITGNNDWSGYMEAGEFPTLYAKVYGENVCGYGRTYGVCPNGTARGAKQQTLAELLSGLAAGTSLTGVSCRVSGRVWWDRFALANASAAACSVLFDSCRPTSFYSLGEEAGGYSPPTSRGPSYLFSRESVSGNVTGSLVLKADGKGVAFAGQAAEGVSAPAFVAVLSPSDFETSSASNGASLAYATTTVERVTAAWRDTSANGRVAFVGTAPVRVRDLDLDTTRISGVVSSGTYPLRYAVDVGADGAQAFGLFLDDGGVFHRIGAFSWPSSESWTSTVSVVYGATVTGVETTDIKRPLVGPTWLDGPKDYPPDDYEKWRSTAGADYHPMLFASSGGVGNVLDSADMHSFASAACSTNTSCIEGVSSGSDFAYGEPKDNPATRKWKDTWVYFRSKVLFSGLTGADTIRTAFQNAYNDISDVTSQCAERTPHDGLFLPGNRNAAAVNEGQLRDIARRILAEPLIVSSGEQTPANTGAQVKWDEDENALTLVGIPEDDSAVVWTLRISSFRTISEAMARRSVAATYALHPYLLTYWHFPMMRP